jgi:hypothetical protein
MKTLKNALKMRRVAEGTLDPWNAGRTQGDGVRKNGDGTITVMAQKR